MAPSAVPGCPVVVDALLTPLGPAVPVARAATVVRLSERAVAIDSEHGVLSGDQVAVAFGLPGAASAAPIVAIAVAQGSSALGDRWRIELAFEQLSAADAARIAAFVAHRPFETGL
jgi:hypothetical protein